MGLASRLRAVFAVHKEGCELCKILLDRAALAISAHARAVARLAGAVGESSEADLSVMEFTVRTARIEHELAVTEYEVHRASHEMKVMTAGS